MFLSLRSNNVWYILSLMQKVYFEYTDVLFLLKKQVTSFLKEQCFFISFVFLLKTVMHFQFLVKVMGKIISFILVLLISL